ncbi:MAG: hypothetical protein DRO09_00090 [Thermoprotei archaeon]|nr:MAG: hypothetical protein DRO09_00090 [Thermoprotei archaeon]
MRREAGEVALEFWWVVTTSTEARALEILDSCDVLVSAGSLWDGCKFKLPYLPRNVKRVFVDSGAQQFYKLKRYPYDAKRYYELCKAVKACFCASLDAPLDEVYVYDYSRGDYEVKGVREGFPREDYRFWLRYTVENALKVFEMYERDGAVKPVLAIQGLRLEWFHECLDMYFEQGFKGYRYWGIGSLCLDKHIDHVVKVAKSLRKRLSDKWVHVWGLDVRAALRLVNVIDSWDTSMWHMLVCPKPQLSARLIPKKLRVWDSRDKSFKEVYVDYHDYGRRRLLELNITAFTEFLRYLEGLSKQAKLA